MLYSGAAVGTAYLAYTLYQKTSRDYLVRVRRSLGKYTNAVDKGGDILQTVLSDLYDYVMHDDSGSEEGAKEVPESLRKVAKLVESREFRVATRSTVRAVLEGISRIEETDDSDNDDGDDNERNVRGHRGTKDGVGVLDKVLGAVLSERGTNLVSLALGMAAKNVVSTFMDRGRANDGNESIGADEKLFAFLSSPRGQELAIRCISACADSAMLAYAQETKGINYYDQMLSTMVKPDHVNLVKECISLSIRAAVSAWNDGDGSAGEFPACAESTIRELGDITSVREEKIDVGDGEDAESPVSALRPPLSSIATPSSAASPRAGQSHASLTPVAPWIHHGLRASEVRLRKATKSPLKISRGRDRGNEGLLRALSKEFVMVSKDEHGREAIAKVAGTVAKEAVGAVANTVADRLDAAYFLSVMLLGVLLAVLCNVAMRSMFG
jgi:hypothetical protein